MAASHVADVVDILLRLAIYVVVSQNRYTPWHCNYARVGKKDIKPRSREYLGHRKATFIDNLLLTGSHTQRTQRASTSLLTREGAD